MNKKTPPKIKPRTYKPKQPSNDLLYKKDVDDLRHQAKIEGLYK